jgi:hypothetical protein
MLSTVEVGFVKTILNMCVWAVTGQLSLMNALETFSRGFWSDHGLYRMTLIYFHSLKIGAVLANLSSNSCISYEQHQLLEIFLVLACFYENITDLQVL